MLARAVNNLPARAALLCALLCVTCLQDLSVSVVTVAPKLTPGGHRPRQDLGQSYLSDPNTAAKIVAAFCAGSQARIAKDGVAKAAVVELGPGLGALTRSLVEKYPGMVAVDIDDRAVQSLRQDLPRLNVLHQDLLLLNHSSLSTQLGGKLNIVGNLPYSITTEALLSLISCPEAVSYSLVMIQKEAADRVLANPGSKDYSSLSVLLQLYAKLRKLFQVPPTAFYPPPKVTSAVIELDFYDISHQPSGVSIELLRETIITCFRQRKRALQHSLKTLLEARRLELPAAWSGRCAEQLRPADFVELTRLLSPTWSRNR